MSEEEQTPRVDPNMEVARYLAFLYSTLARGAAGEQATTKLEAEMLANLDPWTIEFLADFAASRAKNAG